MGSYIALSLLPHFLAQLGVGMLSGRLLAVRRWLRVSENGW